jgi:hypothetical protein
MIDQTVTDESGFYLDILTGFSTKRWASAACRRSPAASPCQRERKRRWRRVIQRAACREIAASVRQEDDSRLLMGDSRLLMGRMMPSLIQTAKNLTTFPTLRREDSIGTARP